MAYQSWIQATTLEDIVAKAADVTMKKQPFIEACKQAGNFKVEDGGARIRVPVTVRAPQVRGTALITGREARNLSVQNHLESMVYDYAFVSRAMSFFLKDRMENKGPKKVGDYAGSTVEATLNALMTDFNDQIFAGTGVDTEEIVSFNGDTGGIFEAATPGTQTGSVGGLSKASYGGNLDNQWYDTGTALTLAGLDLFMIQCSRYSGRPDMLFLRTDAYAKVQSLLGAREQYVAAGTSFAGQVYQLYQGTKMFLAPNLDGVTYASGPADPLLGYALNSQTLEIRVDKDANFKPGQMFPAQDFHGDIADIILKAQIICKDPRSNGIITGPVA